MLSFGSSIIFQMNNGFLKLVLVLMIQAVRSLADDLLRRALFMAWKRNSYRFVIQYLIYSATAYD
jgi:hypothetical protein